MDAAPRSKARPRRCDALREARISFEAVLEPVVLRDETDQHAGRLAVSRDDDLLLLGEAEIPGEVVLDLRKSDLLHLPSPARASQSAASDFGTIARISTACPLTS